MDEKTIEDEAREYVEHVVRKSNQDLETIPPDALERAVKMATEATAELRKAAELAQDAAD